jgi:hypothetical protein
VESFTFVAEKVISPQRATAAMQADATNPFCAARYADVMREQGKGEVWLLGVDGGSQLKTGCYGWMFGKRTQALRIFSLPPVSPDDVFWDGLQQFCSSHRILHLELNSYGSSCAGIPALPGELDRQDHIEHVLDLTDPDLYKRRDENHRRNLKRAQEQGLQLIRTTAAAACEQHVSLKLNTLNRRRSRGELIHDDLNRELHYTTSVTQNGCGELFQAWSGDSIVSSVLILRAPLGAYYWSSGTSEQGMHCGASTFLLHSVTEALRGESFRVFNLGGMDSELGNFKRRFGAAPVSRQHATFFLGSPLRRRISAVAHSLRNIRSALVDRI